MDTIFVLNTNRQVIDVLSNNGSNPSAPFFGDTYTSELDTGAESYEFTTINNARTNITLEVGNYVLFKYNGKYKLFQIMETTDEHSEGKKLLTVYAEMAGMELRNDYCEPFTLEGNFINLLERVLQDTNWRVGTYSESLLYNIQSISYTEPKNVYSIIQENLATFGGVEIEFRVEFIGNQLAALLIDCYESGTRGNKKYRRFEYGKDVKGITRERNINDLATAVIGQGNNNLTFKDIEWSKNLGNPCDKPLQQNFIVDIEANDLWNNGGKYIKTVHKVDTDDPQTLLQECWDYLQEIKQPKFDYDVDLALVAEDYQDIGVGDTNYVLDFDYQPAILLEARVGKLELSFADPRDNKCTLTNYKELVSILQQPVDLNTVGNMIQSKFPIEGEDIAMGAIGEGHINVTYYQAIKTDIMSATLAEVGTLIADKADITDLTALNADIENLRANKAEISDLNATNGNITNLTSQVGQIDTIINNHFTGTDSQILNITAENTTIDNAVIKNAMIDTVSANKVNTGTINSNNVVIESEDGGIKISGATQQFKDNTGTVRVQIGKDAQGNFTFCLFSQDGKGILLDETGIKAGAVPDGLIVNDMVADNANISGGKLDISSVITSINNNTTSIKSSAIKFDDTGQTLQVAFNELKTKVETIENVTIDGDLSSVIEQVTTNTTSIGVMQGQISSLITNTTITKQDGTVVQIKDDYSTTKQTVSELSTKMGSLETNYKKTLKTSSVQYYLSTSLTELAGGSWQDTAPSWAQGKYMWQRMKYTYTDGSTTYGTASCVAGVKGDTGKQGPQGIKGEQGIQGERGPQGNKGATGEKGQSLTSSTPQWYLSTSNTTQTGGSWQDTMPTVTTGKYMWQRWKNVWANPTATTYTTPVLEQIAESVKEVTSKQAEFKQTLDEVKSTLTQTTTTANEAKTQSSTNRQTIDSMSSELTSTTRTANEAKKQTSTNKQSIDSMSTTLTQTTTTANNALNKATTAQQNLDGFKTTVSNTYTTKTDFNNLTIGGRNFLINTKTPKTYTLDTSTSTNNYLTKDPYMTYNHNQLSSYGFKVGDKITVSYDWKVTNVTTYGSFLTELVSYSNSTGTYVGSFSNRKTVTSSETSGRIETTISLTEQMLAANALRIRTDAAKWTFTISNVKLEKGNRVTSWTPAPEDIDEKFTNYSTTEQMNSAIDQKAGEITSTVSSTYTTKTDFNNLTIGGRNLLKDSKTLTKTGGTGTDISTKWIVQNTGSEGFKKLRINTTSTDWIECQVPLYTPINTLSQNLTISFEYQESTAGLLVFNFSVYKADGTRIKELTNWVVSSDFKLLGKPEWKRVSFTFNPSAVNNQTDAAEYRVQFKKASGKTGECSVRKIKLELGNKATDWTPAPEDIDGNITTVKKAVSEVKQTAESVTYKFENSSQANLLPHSGVSSKNTTGWYIEGNAWWYTGHDRYLGLQTGSTSETYAWSPTFSSGASGWYSLHGWINAESNVKSADVFVIGSTDNNLNYDFTHHCSNVGTNSGWQHFSATFEVPSNIRYLRIRVDNNGRVDANNGNFVVVFFGEFMLVRGKDNYPLYTDSVEGLYAGVTSIDKNGVHVTHDDGSSTNLNAKALNFYNSNNTLYAQVANGVYKFWNGSNYIGYLGHAGWSTDTSKRNISFAGEYGNTLTLSAKTNSSDTNYQTWLVVSGHEQTISGVNYHQGVMLIKPRISGTMYFYGNATMGDTYPGMIFANADNHLAVMGDSYVDIGIQSGSKLYNGIRIDEASGNPYTTINMFGNLNMNGWHITNTQSVNSLSATSAASYARRSLSEEESYSDPTVKTITDIFPSQTPTEGEVRWTDRETHFTSEVENGVYECYIEIPWWIAQNLENNYHVNITPTNGFYQYYVSERDPYYFIVRSDKDSMGFTFEIVGKLLDNNTIANNTSIAGDQYLASDLKEPEAANIVTEPNTVDIITPDTTSDI